MAGVVGCCRSRPAVRVLAAICVPGLGVVVSRFTEGMFRNALTSVNGLVTGEPRTPVRHTWAEVHQMARQIASGLAAAGVGHGSRVGVLAGAPVEGVSLS